jgi:hypothetical protein
MSDQKIKEVATETPVNMIRITEYSDAVNPSDLVYVGDTFLRLHTLYNQIWQLDNNPFVPDCDVNSIKTTVMQFIGNIQGRTSISKAEYDFIHKYLDHAEVTVKGYIHDLKLANQIVGYVNMMNKPVSESDDTFFYLGIAIMTIVTGLLLSKIIFKKFNTQNYV